MADLDHKPKGSSYDLSDVNIRGLVMFVCGLTVMTVAVYFLVWGMFRALGRREKEPPPSPMALSHTERLPPEPRLQSAQGFGEQLEKESGATTTSDATAKPKDPLWEIEALRGQWESVLKDGKDSQGKVVAISIDQAKEQLLKNDAAANNTESSSAKAEDYAVETPTAASSGRTTEKRRQ
jgi:hypothetical protein